MTALTATPLPESAAVRLDVTGAPLPGVTVYTQAGGLDSWTADANSSLAAGTPGWMLTRSAVYADPVRASRVVTGLTIGQQYRYRHTLESAVPDVVRARLGVVGIGQNPSWSTLPAEASSVVVEYVFTATATSHTIFAEFDEGTFSDVRAVASYGEVVHVPNGALPTTIVRVDANGTNPVRLREGEGPIGGAMTVTDYEAALVGPIRYDLTDSAGVMVSTSTSLDGLVALPQLHVARLPQYRAALDSVLGYNRSRESTAVVHTVIGRDDPVVSLGVLLRPRGPLEIWAPDFPAALAIEALANRGEVLQFRQPTHPGMDMYLSTGSVEVTPRDGRWIVRVEYAEVKNPVGPLLGGAGWTFAALLARGGTFASLATEFDTFADLAVGP